MSQPAKQPEEFNWRPVIAIAIGIGVAYIVEAFLGLGIQSLIKTMAWVGSFFIACVVGLICAFAYYERGFMNGLARLLMPFYMGRVKTKTRGSFLEDADEEWERASGVPSISSPLERFDREDRSVINTLWRGVTRGAKVGAVKHLKDKERELTEADTALAKAETENVRAKLDRLEAENKKTQELLIERRERQRAYLIAKKGVLQASREIDQLEKQWKREDQEIEAFVGESLERARALQEILTKRYNHLKEIEESKLPRAEKKKQRQIVEQYYSLQLAQMGITLSQPQLPQGEEDEWL